MCLVPLFIYLSTFCTFPLFCIHFISPSLYVSIFFLISVPPSLPPSFLPSFFSILRLCFLSSILHISFPVPHYDSFFHSFHCSLFLSICLFSLRSPIRSKTIRRHTKHTAKCFILRDIYPSPPPKKNNTRAYHNQKIKTNLTICRVLCEQTLK